MTNSVTHTARGRKIAIALAFAGALPTPLPLTWLHKFYLGQYLWGIVYLVLAPTMLPKVACCLEGIWYLSQSDERFLAAFPRAAFPQVDAALANASTENPEKSRDFRQDVNLGSAKAQAVQQVAIALRELDQLRQEGLMSEYEFEQKRRKLLADIV